MKKVGNTVAEQELDEMGHDVGVKVWRERILTEDELFHGVDEAGRTGWFLRLSLTGLYPRRVGPYHTKEEALDVLESVAAAFVQEPLIDLLNDLTATQACVQEGVPPLAATSSR